MCIKFAAIIKFTGVLNAIKGNYFHNGGSQL